MATNTTAVTVTTSATRLDSPVDDDPSAPGQDVTYYNNGAVTVWLGGPDVTVGNGIPLQAGAYADEHLYSRSPSYGIVASGTCEVRVKQVGV